MIHRRFISLILAFMLLSLPTFAFAKVDLSSTREKGGDVSFAFQYDRVALSIQKQRMQEDGAVGGGGQTGYYQGLMEGKVAAETGYSSGGWFLGGVGMGLLLGLIGTVIIGVASTGSVEPSTARMMMIQEKPSDFQKGFLEGFSRKAKSKNLVAHSAVAFLVRWLGC